MKPPVARKLAVGQLSFLATGGFKFLLFQSACMVYKHSLVAAFCICAQPWEDAAKRGSWRLCIK